MNLLGIDFGTKRIGLSWVDTDIGAVLPFGLISGDNTVELKKKLLDIITEENPDVIVFGLPLSLDNNETPTTLRTRKFAEEIKQETGKQVEFFDERFSSQLADRFSEGDASRDEMAAVAILQDYISRK